MQRPKIQITQEILDRLPEIEKAFAYYLIDKKELVLVNDLSSKENPQAIAWDEKIVLQRW